MSLARVLAQLSTGGGLPKRVRPFANQAANEAFLRFAPEWDQLNSVREQSAQTLRQNVGQANSAAQLISALANQSQQTLNSSQNPLVQRLAAYDNAPANSSAAVVAQNLGLTHDAASSMLAQAASNAPLRAQQQGLQALTAHQQDLGKINAQRASLAGQVGAFTQGRLGDLVNVDRTNRAKVSAQRRQIESQLTQTNIRDETTRRGQDLSHADRQAALDARSTGKLPGGVKLNTPQQHDALKDSVASAQALVTRQVAAEKSLAAEEHRPFNAAAARRRIAQTLISGRPAQIVEIKPGERGYDPTDPSKNKIHAPELPKVSQLALSIALDQAFDSHLSGHNVNELHRRGYSVKTLGFNTTPPARKPRRPARRVAGSYGPAGPVNA